jgi:hypothetical protein
MAFTPTNNLKSDSQVTLRDQQHAARVFVDDQFRLAPKHKFLFHVAFGINQGALRSTDLVQRYGSEINMLVKSIDLPSYGVQTEVLNQYNRKKVVQYTHKPGEVAVKFHDDSMGLINQLWQNYYSYYYADSVSSKTGGSYSRNATKSSDFIQTPYGLDNGSTDPFFNYIKVYQMSRHEYTCYELKNPIITNWNHNKLDYSQNAVHDFDMKLMYEAVTYSTGQVSSGDIEGFGVEHYDKTPSPLTASAQSATNNSFASSLNLDSVAPSILNTVITQINTAQNTKTINSLSGLTNLTNTIATASGGLQGFTFPR